jgi:hypothetical protein
MKYGYVLDKEFPIFPEDVSLFDYRTKTLTASQRTMLESANPHLFDDVKSVVPTPATSGESAYLNHTPGVILLEPGLILEQQLEEHRELVHFQPRGIAKKFSQLKTTNDILAFANTYGLLGCKLVEYTQILESPTEYLDRFSYHHSYFEPLKVWEWHIDHVKKLFQIYRALRYKTEIENELLLIKMSPRNEVIPIDYGFIYWNDGKLIGFGYEPFSDGVDYTKIARRVLVKQVITMLKGAIDLSYESIVDDEKSELGFRLNETRMTRFLLAAIYYDLWYTITNHQAVSVCEYCDGSFTPSKRRKYCCDACKQAAYRKNKEGGTENG